MIRKSATISGLLVLLLPCLALADPQRPPGPENLSVHMIVTAIFALPVFAAYLFLIWLFQRFSQKRVRNYMRRADEHLTHSAEHMNRVEEQTGEMIALLRSINAKLDA